MQPTLINSIGTAVTTNYYRVISRCSRRLWPGTHSPRRHSFTQLRASCTVWTSPSPLSKLFKSQKPRGSLFTLETDHRKLLFMHPATAPKVVRWFWVSHSHSSGIWFHLETYPRETQHYSWCLLQHWVCPQWHPRSLRHRCHTPQAKARQPLLVSHARTRRSLRTLLSFLWHHHNYSQ